MVKRIGCLLSAMVFSCIAYAQVEKHEPVFTAPPDAARFEIIQNSRAMRESYLLNRYTGETWQLTESATEKRAYWKRIPIEFQESDALQKNPPKPTYQISISGLAAKGSYLINTTTGTTWILYEDPEKGIFWGAISPPK